MDRLLQARINGQSGLVTRAQALAAGVTDRAIQWRVERGRWVRVHSGIYLTTPGRDDWEVRAVSALLLAGPGSALAGRSAGHAWGLIAAAPSQIELVIPTQRRVQSVAGVKIRRSRHVPDRIHQSAWPHRVAVEHTVFDLAQGATLDRSISLAAKAIGIGLATPATLLNALRDRYGQTQRQIWSEIFADIGAGAESTAEVRYVRGVERAHGLPVGVRQTPIEDGGRRDVEYKEWEVIVEIDGRLGHEGWRARQREGRRDRKAATTGRITVRCHWPDLVPTGCELADDLAKILMTRGWPGPARPCGPDCPVGAPSIR